MADCCCCGCGLINDVAFDCYDVIDDVTVMEVTDSRRPAKFTTYVLELGNDSIFGSTLVDSWRPASIRYDSLSRFLTRFVVVKLV